MSQITNFRIKIYPDKNSGACGDLCDVCCADFRRGKDIYINVIPYELYVALLNSSSHVFADGICKDEWGEEQCDLTREIFSPTFLLYLCDECYKKHIRPVIIRAEKDK